MTTIEEKRKIVELVKIGAQKKISEMKEINLDEVCTIAKVVNEVVDELEFFERLEKEKAEKGEAKNA
uniref:Uncharacterized protein n=1 Tax=Siphoviridae sp. cttDR14 TaxID=2826490 RepID=A0A8S5M2F7_9CAUD|nr:MAG TPA: hypothetical protein [Siphoviridae sp. cttDR14]